MDYSGKTWLQGKIKTKIWDNRMIPSSTNRTSPREQCKSQSLGLKCIRETPCPQQLRVGWHTVRLENPTKPSPALQLHSSYPETQLTGLLTAPSIKEGHLSRAQPCTTPRNATLAPSGQEKLRPVLKPGYNSSHHRYVWTQFCVYVWEVASSKKEKEMPKSVRKPACGSQACCTRWELKCFLPAHQDPLPSPGTSQACLWCGSRCPGPLGDCSPAHWVHTSQRCYADWRASWQSFWVVHGSPLRLHHPHTHIPPPSPRHTHCTSQTHHSQSPRQRFPGLPAKHCKAKTIVQPTVQFTEHLSSHTEEARPPTSKL